MKVEERHGHDTQVSNVYLNATRYRALLLPDSATRAAEYRLALTSPEDVIEGEFELVDNADIFSSEEMIKSRDLAIQLSGLEKLEKMEAITEERADIEESMTLFDAYLGFGSMSGTIAIVPKYGRIAFILE